MKRDVKCGVCGLEQGNGVQIIYPTITVRDGKAIYRCSNCLNLPPKQGEAEKYVIA